MKRYLLVSILLLTFTLVNAQKIGQWSRFEIAVENPDKYQNPFTEVQLLARFTRPDGSSLELKGFYDGNNVWRVRIMPDQIGKWKYSIRFSSGSSKPVNGSFKCIASDIPGLIAADETNPVWFGYKGGKHQLIRCFHVGDRFFAENWPDSARTEFLNWLTQNGYNTISVASHLLNRNDEKRGRGWDTPNLWDSVKHQPNPAEYTKMERILNELGARKIVVFPFAGFFGQKSNYPRDSVAQTLYISYTIARLGSYWNTLYSVAGPEPLYRNVKQFTESEVDRLGKMIAVENNQQHLLTVHNEKNQNPFVNAPWASYQCLQGPTTLNTDTLYNGLMSRRNPKQPLLAQEVLWYGNIYQQTYNDLQLRKNAFTIMMAGAALNFADNAGTSSTGFTGTLNLKERHQDKHEIIKKVWDFMESIPFYKLTPSTTLCTRGFGMEKAGEIYLIYLPQGGDVTVNVVPANYTGTWIKGSDTNIRVSIGITDGRDLTAPSDEDWLLYLRKAKPASTASNSALPVLVGFGSYPDITADKYGMLHIAYAREGKLYYRYFDPVKNQLGPEVFTTLCYPPDKYLGANRSDPEILVDHQGKIHVLVGQEYAFSNGKDWVKINPGVTRDTDMGMNTKGVVFINNRGGNHEGHIGIRMKKADSDEFIPTETDPDVGTNRGTEWLGKGDHVYGSIFVDNNDVIHLVYRQAEPAYVSYRQSADNGKTWKGCGVYGGHEWQGEAPDITVSASGKVMVVSHDGELYTLNPNTFTFSPTRLITCSDRDLPSISAGDNDLVCVSAFGGIFNSMKNGKPGLERKLNSITGKPIGFVDNVVNRTKMWLVFEEGDSINNKEPEGTSAIFVVGLNN